ncbi:SMI1/KNR4 family protein [Cytobacillus massiliigabonensis]|uniref:SMI1/KNR4 family protein n=1 Tax=Cytobacillus massiliigabonensis TaxID=1871011 RepID=UPI000C82EC79|nr:SMI1/KNR4 family protein [Cytobacillus massiliigabonensis]
MINKAERLWQRIVERGLNNDSNFKESLNLQPGASDEELQLIEDTLGVTLPEEMKCFYKVYNGQEWDLGVNPFVRNLTLSPTSEIIDNWCFLQEEFDPDDDLELDSSKELKPFLWNSKWIPIAANGGGDYLCIDTDPSEAGVEGQLLYFWHDWGNRSVKAKSLFEFIEICLKEDYEEYQ